ncbi:MAG TPA: ATP-binding protein [Thermoanaerobaculia bacterium]|nr:response regulator [Thermoanaerobaculia bacterium]MBP7814189.1 response regulator [Thermoanaerobaculia bacterium]MBP8845065.1 response regulator [Thermoanaerobaculia bacterium]HPA95624.1 ATP-binding protein [Thermoanaerobaculia bacterium]HQP92638.1 ATP-binding protein [Thermoanaerobaculia bacterium]
METLRVLMVEDEAAMRAAVSRALSRYTLRLPDIEGEYGFAIEEAGSAEEGLARIEASPPDIVLLDHKLPGMSGVELLGILAEKQPPVSFLTVMMTAYATLENAVVATKRGAYDFLAKPFTPDELRSVVSKTTRHLLLTRETRRLAQEKRQVRFQLLSVIVHELKAPLAAIEGYLYLLQDPGTGSDPAVYKKAVDRSLVRIGGMRKLITDLLDLTRIESGQKRRELVPLELADVARAAIESVQPEAERRGIAVTLHAPEPVPMVADRAEMEILFNNLLTNAVKYNRDGGTVTVRLTGGERVRIEVADTGIGMTPEETARLFHEFVRIKNEKTRNIPGSGLGLSVVRKLAHLNGGEVTVESSPGVGSTFTVEIAAHSPEAQETEPE